MLLIPFLLLISIQHEYISADARLIRSPCTNPVSIPTSLPNFLLPEDELKKRQVGADDATCGFADGDANSPRTADPGFNCRVDTRNALWGFCPTTVISAIDCGLAGFCEDEHDCTDGCGLEDRPDITTFTCDTAQFCSTVLLTAGPDQTYSYIACGNRAATDHLLAAPTTTKTTSSPSSSETSLSATQSLSVPTPSSTTNTSPSEETTSVSSLDSTKSSTSPTASAISDTPTSKSSNSSPSLVGPIVGGVIGGLGLIVFAVLGFLFLRKYRRDHPPTPPPKARLSNEPPLHSDGVQELAVKEKPVEMDASKATSHPFELSA